MIVYDDDKWTMNTRIIRCKIRRYEAKVKISNYSTHEPAFNNWGAFCVRVIILSTEALTESKEDEEVNSQNNEWHTIEKDQKWWWWAKMK